MGSFARVGVLLAAVLCLAVLALGQQTSAPVVFTVAPAVAVPTVSVTAPRSVSAGAPQFVLTVTGANFSASSVVQWQNAAANSSLVQLATTFVSPTQLTAVVPAALVSSAGTASVTVLNPIVTSQHRVGLSWAASATAGVTYRLRRGLSHGGPYSLIASGVAATQAVDATVAGGVTYYYVATAVDGLGNESVFSNEAVAVVPA